MTKSSKSGFTLLELLVVIGIILILVSLLLPVISSVRNAAYNANTKSQIGKLVNAMERYYQDFSSYPGPFKHDLTQINSTTPAYANYQIGSSITLAPAAGSTLTISSARNITPSENLVLGLLGGLNMTLNATNVITAFNYDKQQLGNGAVQLNAANPKRYPAYLQYSANELTSGFSGLPSATDTEIPEFVDRFPDNGSGVYGGVIIYARANIGSANLLSNSRTVYDSSCQYNLKDVTCYVSNTTGSTANYDLSFSTKGDFPNVSSNSNVVLTTGNVAYFGNPKLSYWDTSASAAVRVARQADGYWLISPGPDRIYGTKDDVTNFDGFK